MRIRLMGAVTAMVIALGGLAFPSATPARAGSTCTGWTSTVVPPTTIRVYRTATKRTQRVLFRTYVEKVMAAEWNAAAPAAALRIGAVAVKQYAWYYAIHWRGGRDAAGRCYDVRDSSRDQIYNPAKVAAPTHRAAVAATWWVSLRKGSKFFLTGYRPGTGSCAANIDGWRLYQRDAVDCVRRYGDRAEALGRRFYSSVSWSTRGIGDVTGDGRGDMSLLTVAPDTGATSARVLTSDGAFLAAVAAGPFAAVNLATTPANALLGRVAGDVTGDGRADIVQLVRTKGGTALQVIAASPSGLTPAATWRTDAVDPALAGASSFRLVVADFNGDGTADAGIVRVVAGDAPSTTLLLASSTGATFRAPVATWTTAADLATSQFRAGDVTGDGRGDLVVLSPGEAGGTRLLVARSTPKMRLGTLAAWGTEPLALDAIRVLVGDVNRDGRDDLIVVRRSGKDGVQVVVQRAPATGALFAPRLFTGVLTLSFARTRFAVSDMSGDARADLLALVDRGRDGAGAPLGTNGWRLFSTGSTFTPKAWFSNASMRWDTAFPY